MIAHPPIPLQLPEGCIVGECPHCRYEVRLQRLAQAVCEKCGRVYKVEMIAKLTRVP